MATNLISNGGSAFRIRRPVITSSGFVSDIDPTAKSHLDELNEILGKKIFHRETSTKLYAEDAPSKTAEPAEDEIIDLLASSTAKTEIRKGKGGKHFVEETRVVPNLQELLRRPLTPKHTPDGWAKDSLAHEFKHAEAREEWLTLSELIDALPSVSSLKYAFQGSVAPHLNNLPFNVRTVLENYPAISNYLVAFAYSVMDLQEVNGLKNFIITNPTGARNVANYASVSAARSIIEKEQLKVPGYNEDGSEVVRRIREKELSLSTTSFVPAVKAIVNDFVFNSDEMKVIAAAEKVIGKIPATLYPQLIKFITKSQSTKFPITEANAGFFLPQFITQIQGSNTLDDSTEGDRVTSDEDFDVDFFTDDTAMIQVSKSAVKCAAQLYYSMIVGDELDVFDIVNYFTHRYLLRGGIEIQDSRLREDLQQYVFSSRFTDLKTKKLVDRTRPAERYMFYKQVFNYGAGQVTEDVVVNSEFPRLWKVLILESAKYIERAQAAFNPDSYVSRQNVMQAVEDLQYNLSTNCIGMVNVISPLIYAELNFVVQRILMHSEVIRQIQPTGGTWWRVAEKLKREMDNRVLKATVEYNKAKLGHDIINSIADYNPASFEDDQTFSDFISNVDAFITTQSILQDTLIDQLKAGDEDREDNEQKEMGKPMPEASNGATSTNVQSGAGDEWDF